MSDSLWPHGLHSPRNSPGQNTGVGSLSLLQEIFPTQRSNPGLLHCRRILYQLSHKGSPKIRMAIIKKSTNNECWSGYPIPSPGDLPNPGIKPRSPTLQANSLPAEPQGKPKSAGVVTLSLLQRIFLTQESNRDHLHCMWFFINWAIREAQTSHKWVWKLIFP